MKLIQKIRNDEERITNVCIGLIGILLVVFSMLFMK